MTDKQLHEIAQALRSPNHLGEDQLVEMHLQLWVASLDEGRTEEYLRNEMEAQMHMMEVLVGTAPTRAMASKLTMVAAKQRIEIRELKKQLEVAQKEGGFAA